MNSERIVISGLGMITSLGSDSITSCASARAGILRISDLDYEILNEDDMEMEALQGHRASDCPSGFEGMGRLIQLGTKAMSDLLNYSKLNGNWASDTAVFLHLSDNYFEQAYLKHFLQIIVDDPSEIEDQMSEARERYLKLKNILKRTLLPQILKLNKISITQESCFYSFGGPAGFVEMMRKALDKLNHNQYNRCILGGIDSLIQSNDLRILKELNLLRTNRNTNGFFPGEAGAFVLIEKMETAKSRNAPIHVSLESPIFSKEAVDRFSESSPDGQILFQVIKDSLANSGISFKEINLLIGNLNGDSWYAHEFGNMLTRMRYERSPEALMHWFTPLFFGETGAATGPIAIALAVRGFGRSYVKSPTVLIWLSSYDGYKAAFPVQKFLD